MAEPAEVVILLVVVFFALSTQVPGEGRGEPALLLPPPLAWEAAGGMLAITAGGMTFHNEV
jgi:hypothetical protein